MYTQFFMEISQNITVLVRTWVYRTCEELPWEQNLYNYAL